MEKYFSHNERLGIALPDLTKPFNEYPVDVCEEILFNWEKIRGTIPDRVKELESIINKKQKQLNKEEDFSKSCKLNSEISELASIINDLLIWYRFQQHIRYTNPNVIRHT